MERWIMNRFGFVNFWVYDDEVFPLRDGKILLRGSNGSGKSITTQSFIPYILDGDRQPSRLDPFGSKDRKMSFYLLDDRGTEKDESTGYLYLEFVKPASQQYRTIGIGLHARKGGSMNTWGFCILDGRRIGYDFSLYRSVGGKNIPYDTRKLKEELGEYNLFTEKMSEYKEIVARNIFGIAPENISDYDNLTDILIKTRSSKLASKENLKPAQLYEVLNESMKTLSDEELRPMAEAMNRIEEIHEKIEDAQRALAESKHICAEYKKYNEYVLWNKSRRYSKKHREVLELRSRTENLEKEISEASLLSRENEETAEKNRLILSDSKREKESLDFTDIDARISQKQRAESSLENSRKEEVSKRKLLDDKQSQIKRKYSEKKDICSTIEDFEYELENHMKEYRTYEEYQFSVYENYLEQIKDNPDFGNMGSTCMKECRQLSDSLKKALDAIKAYDSEKKREDDSLQKLDAARRDAESAEAELNSAEKALDEQRDILIERYYTASKENREFIIDDDTLTKLERTVSAFDGSGSASELYNILSVQNQYINSRLIEKQMAEKTLLSELREDYNENCRKLDELKNTKEAVPERNQRRTDARKKLDSRGIKYYSYYECIDFKEEVSKEIRSAAEAALIDSGIIDALVIPETSRDDAEKILGDISDCIVINSAPDSEENRYFRNVFDFSVPFPDIDDNGFYQSGMIFGHAESYGNVRYIGAESRRKFREKMIEELELQKDESLKKFENQKIAVAVAEAAVKTLAEEYSALTDTTDLSAACTLADRCRNQLDISLRYAQKCEEEYSAVKSSVQVFRVESERLCNSFPYSRNAEEFSEVYDSSVDFMEEVQEIISVLKNIRERKRELESVNEYISDLEMSCDEAEYDLKKLLGRIHDDEETIRLCDEFLNNSENISRKKRAVELAVIIEKAEKAISESEKDAAGYRERISILSGQLETENGRLSECEAAEKKLFDIFTEELRLGFNEISSEITPEKACTVIEREMPENEKQRSMSEIQERLSDMYRKHSSVLSSEYGMTLEHCFEDDDSDTVRRRMQIQLMWCGHKITPFEFEKELGETIENDRVMIRKNEENMFKDILLNTISKKLYCRIEESMQWVDSMAELMKSINTSMGLTFSLSWKPKKDIGENEIGYDELSSILVKSRDLISAEDFEKLSEHFRSKIELEKMILEEKGCDINYSDIIRNVLDFRNWFEFRLHFRQAGALKFNELTNSRFNTFSGGERALCLYIPLFAAVAAQYQKAGEQAPLIIALDEAFAGVDDSNISEMFGLLEKLGFGYIMNSQALWGCYETVSSLEIAELFHEKESAVITVILYEWNGKQKILEG